eukprot:6205441-Pleurochrysis_carterae.AAC.9
MSTPSNGDGFEHQDGDVLPSNLVERSVRMAAAVSLMGGSPAQASATRGDVVCRRACETKSGRCARE